MLFSCGQDKQNYLKGSLWELKELAGPNLLFSIFSVSLLFLLISRTLPPSCDFYYSKWHHHPPFTENRTLDVILNSSFILASHTKQLPSPAKFTSSIFLASVSSYACFCCSLKNLNKWQFQLSSGSGHTLVVIHESSVSLMPHLIHMEKQGLPS